MHVSLFPWHKGEMNNDKKQNKNWYQLWATLAQTSTTVASLEIFLPVVHP